MLTKDGDIKVIEGASSEPAHTGNLHPEAGEILLLSSKGDLDRDLDALRKVPASMSEVPVLLIDGAGDETSFLQCIRAGVRGYLPRDASADDVVGAVKAVHEGKAVCPGALCAALFRYVEREATCLPSATVHHAPRATTRPPGGGRAHQQGNRQSLLPLRTNGEESPLSHEKIGAGERLGIVQMCRTQGFLV